MADWKPVDRAEARMQPCPWCHVRAGQYCRDPWGEEIETCHESRWAAARQARIKARSGG